MIEIYKYKNGHGRSACPFILSYINSVCYEPSIHTKKHGIKFNQALILILIYALQRFPSHYER